jgi:hypothetical protein
VTVHDVGERGLDLVGAVVVLDETVEHLLRDETELFVDHAVVVEALGAVAEREGVGAAGLADRDVEAVIARHLFGGATP